MTARPYRFWALLARKARRFPDVLRYCREPPTARTIDRHQRIGRLQDLVRRHTVEGILFTSSPEHRIVMFTQDVLQADTHDQRYELDEQASSCPAGSPFL